MPTSEISGVDARAAQEAAEQHRRRRAVAMAVAVSLGVHMLPVIWWTWPGTVPEPSPVQADAPPIVIELAPVTQSVRSMPSDLRVAQDRKQVDRSVVQPRLLLKEPTIERTNAAVEPVVALRERTERPPEQKQAQQSHEEQAAAAAPQLIAQNISQQTTAAVAGASARVSDARQTWESQVVAALEKVKRYPQAARWAGSEDTVLVRFAIAANGSVSGVRIIRSQRFSPLDNEALSLPVRAAPLPPPPASIADGLAVVTVPIDFYLQGK